MQMCMCVHKQSNDRNGVPCKLMFTVKMKSTYKRQGPFVPITTASTVQFIFLLCISFSVHFGQFGCIPSNEIYKKVLENYV